MESLHKDSDCCFSYLLYVCYLFQGCIYFASWSRYDSVFYKIYALPPDIVHNVLFLRDWPPRFCQISLKAVVVCLPTFPNMNGCDAFLSLIFLVVKLLITLFVIAWVVIELCSFTNKNKNLSRFHLICKLNYSLVSRCYSQASLKLVR